VRVSGMNLRRRDGESLRACLFRTSLHLDHHSKAYPPRLMGYFPRRESFARLGMAALGPLARASENR